MSIILFYFYYYYYHYFLVSCLVDVLCVTVNLMFINSKITLGESVPLPPAVPCHWVK